MEYNRFDIGLEIENSGIFIIGLDNDILTVSLDLAKFLEINANKIESLGDKLDVGDIAKPLNPYDIFNTLENQGKNTYNNTKIIEKIETPDFIEYHFHYGLILNVFANKENKVILEHIKKKIPKKAFINPIYFSYDIIGDSNAIPQDEISDLTKNYGYERKNYKSIFKKEVYINYSCLERLYFANCEFKSKVSLHHIDGSDNLVTFFNGIDFANCIFEDEINFKRFTSGSPLPDGKYYNNEQNTLFENCIFKKRVDFHNSKFVNSVYFTNSHFKDYADFHACEFEKTACFYGVTFEKTPNFSQVVFKDSVNLVNIKTNFNFEILNTTINNIDKPKDESANDFRDSFRTFKSALIKENNPLEASNFHKYELYCKEIELEEKKPKVFSKEWVDKWQLFFYRKLCDHHTDLLLNLKWLIITIGMFASMLFMIKLYNHGLCILNAFNFYGLYLSALGSFILSALALFRCIDKMKAFVGINAMAILWVICYKPKLIFGIANLIGDNSYNAFENLLITLYTLIVGLIIFSLQKTARKNSIIPT
ncbi:pentapeptide repeat-containing protein [Campylobacter insulaenigrae]|uniref:pentapeptide repeat-containing protein n=1 Tax=Campylobacter insulaenigrae TaxID=260714 RepID=UPI00215346A8|nr:pentapeptide repeat-containing protein [Campylobacter insulaenigrae]MCR6575312.1 pentapeptide repeat-containing protein [Campylobacter insulaenigrae]